MDIDEDIIIRYLQEDCDEADFQRLNEWLAKSEEHQEQLFELEALWKSRNRKRYESADYLNERLAGLNERIGRKQEKTHKSPLRKRLLRYAAAIAVLVSLGWMGLHIAADRSLEVLTADQGKVEHIVMPDGTEVWLNQSGTLKYPARFKGKKREVYLEGEGYFEVAGNEDLPFIVQTGNLEVTVLGTSFNVNSGKDSDISSVALLEGEVKVKGRQDEGMVILSPGQKAELHKSSKRLVVKTTGKAAADAVWHDGLISFKQASMSDIAEMLETIYDVHIESDPQIPSATYSGVLKKQSDITLLLDDLCKVVPISYETDGSNIYIRRR